MNAWKDIRDQFDLIKNSKPFTLRKKCPYSELFWSVFSRIRTEYAEILNISPYSVRIWENTDRKNSEKGHFSRSVYLVCILNAKLRIIFL